MYKKSGETNIAFLSYDILIIRETNSTTVKSLTEQILEHDAILSALDLDGSVVVLNMFDLFASFDIISAFTFTKYMDDQALVFG